jgi:phosphatidylserine decarboxylase
MATDELNAPVERCAVPMTSIQPGGGFCMRLELAWGRLRRALLRRLCPTYARTMLAKRQGHCENCSHDIIDPRDLKFYRNVCGYWFRAEDDRFGWRGQLRLARAGLAELIFFSAVLVPLLVLFSTLAVLVHPLLWLPAGVAGLLWLFIISFFRDPERVIPSDPLALVSPADGTVTHVDEVEEPDFPGGRALRVSIFLSVFNVHVNRVPRPGRVLGLRYFPGRFEDARSLTCGIVNEQLWIDLSEGPEGRPVRVKQIAGAIARRIVCWLRPGEEVGIGERLGMIKFGSRTEVSLPADAVEEVLVKPGDKVKGASSVLLRVKRDGNAAP